jgi:hypothetical protein
MYGMLRISEGCGDVGVLKRILYYGCTVNTRIQKAYQAGLRDITLLLMLLHVKSNGSFTAEVTRTSLFCNRASFLPF